MSVSPATGEDAGENNARVTGRRATTEHDIQTAAVTVTADATAIIDRMEAELLALAAQRQPQQALLGNIIEGEVIG